MLDSPRQVVRKTPLGAKPAGEEGFQARGGAEPGQGSGRPADSLSSSLPTPSSVRRLQGQGWDCELPAVPRPSPETPRFESASFVS